MDVVADGAMRSASGATDLPIDSAAHVTDTAIHFVDDFRRRRRLRHRTDGCRYADQGCQRRARDQVPKH
jgi:hypothetical protein